MSGESENRQKSVVVIGNGMVGHKFCEKLLELDSEGQYKITTFCEEPRAAYNRMRLTEVSYNFFLFIVIFIDFFKI